MAAAKGQATSVRFLLEHGADANVVDSFGLTPLFEAVRKKGLEWGKPSACSQNQLIVASLALAPPTAQVTRCHGEVAAILRAHGGDMGLRSARVWEAGGPGSGGDKRDAGTLICKICADGDVKTLKSFLENGLGASGGRPLLRVPPKCPVLLCS